MGLRCGAHNGPPHTTHCVIHLWDFQSGGWEKVWDLSVSQTCMQQYNTTTPKHMNQQTYNVVVNSFVGTLGIMKISSFRLYTPYNVFVHYFVLFHMICIFNFYFQILPLFVERWYHYKSFSFQENMVCVVNSSNIYIFICRKPICVV